MSTDKKRPIIEQKSIIKSTTILSVGTLSSRILGFLRDIIFASLLGTAVSADAFFVAFRIPNLLRSLVGEGAVNSAFVPVFTEYLYKKDKKELLKVASILLFWVMAVLSFLTVVGIFLSPFIVRLIAPGFVENVDKLQLTIRLTKIMFPYLFFIGLAAYGMGLLYTFRSFYASAFSPCLLNIVLIASALISRGDIEIRLAIGVLIGGLMQLGIHVFFLVRKGIKFQKPDSLVHPVVKRIGTLLLPRLFGTGIYQLNVFIDTLCASFAHFVGAGGISAIYYSNRLVQFPLGVFGVSLASAVLPTMSKLASEDNIEDFKSTIVFAMKNILFVMLPASLFFLLFAAPVVRVLFERGEFSEYSTKITSQALFFYAIGIISYCGMKIIVSAFHSLQDTKTPVKVAAVCLIINAVLNFVLMIPLKVGGIALASSISVTINFFALLYFLTRRIGAIRFNVIFYLLKVLSASLAMCFLMKWLWHSFIFWNDFVKLFIVIVSGFCVFMIAGWFLRIEQVAQLSNYCKGSFMKKESQEGEKNEK